MYSTSDRALSAASSTALDAPGSAQMERVWQASPATPRKPGGWEPRNLSDARSIRGGHYMAERRIHDARIDPTPVPSGGQGEYESLAGRRKSMGKGVRGG